MISDITLGQFFPGRSVLHRLDPRTKILMSVFFIVAIFLAKSILAFSLMTLFVVFLIANSGISLKVILKGIKPIIYILIFTALINVFMVSADSTPLVEFWVIKIYKEGIIRRITLTDIKIALIIPSL